MLIPITLKEILSLAQKGDEDAMIALLKKYKPLIGWGMRYAIILGISTEDIENDIILCMIILFQKFDINRML